MEIIAGTAALSIDAVQQLKYAWAIRLIVYGFGILLIILAGIQLWACKTENRLAIFIVFFTKHDDKCKV